MRLLPSNKVKSREMIIILHWKRTSRLAVAVFSLWLAVTTKCHLLLSLHSCSNICTYTSAGYYEPDLTEEHHQYSLCLYCNYEVLLSCYVRLNPAVQLSHIILTSVREVAMTDLPLVFVIPTAALINIPPVSELWLVSQHIRSKCNEAF